MTRKPLLPRERPGEGPGNAGAAVLLCTGQLAGGGRPRSPGLAGCTVHSVPFTLGRMGPAGWVQHQLSPCARHGGTGPGVQARLEADCSQPWSLMPRAVPSRQGVPGLADQCHSFAPRWSSGSSLTGPQSWVCPWRGEGALCPVLLRAGLHTQPGKHVGMHKSRAPVVWFSPTGWAESLQGGRSSSHQL